MADFCIQKDDFAQLADIMRRVRYCLRNGIGFSLVRVGDAENQVLAQGSVYGEESIKQIWWAEYPEWTGITLPNYEARDRMILSLRQADMVGVLHQSDAYEWKTLTEEMFSKYNIKPRDLCYAFINMYLPQSNEFKLLLKEHQVLLIGKLSNVFADYLKCYLGISPAGSITIDHYDQIIQIEKMIQNISFDIALLSAGSNAVILAPFIASYNKVALDIGRAMNPRLWPKSAASSE
jgi:hypothetical protein